VNLSYKDNCDLTYDDWVGENWAVHDAMQEQRVTAIGQTLGGANACRLTNLYKTRKRNNKRQPPAGIR